MEMGVKRERRSAATLAPLCLCCERERPNWPRCSFQGDYLARLFDISASAPITKWRRRYVGAGEEPGIKRYFLRITVAILKG